MIENVFEQRRLTIDDYNLFKTQLRRAYKKRNSIMSLVIEFIDNHLDGYIEEQKANGSSAILVDFDLILGYYTAYEVTPLLMNTLIYVRAMDLIRKYPQYEIIPISKQLGICIQLNQVDSMKERLDLPLHECY